MQDINMKEQKTSNWQTKKLGEVCDKISLNKIKIKQKDYLLQGKFPVIDQGQNIIGGYFDDENLVVPNEPPFIIFGDHTKVKKFIAFKFIAGADGVKVLKAKENVLPKFLFYLLHTIKIENKGYARHFQLLEKESFLFPEDLETQHAIVSKIEELFSELDKGIAELKTAQQQLKTYRQSVLKSAFEGKLTNENIINGELPEGWEIKKLNQVAKIISGFAFKSSDFISKGIPVVKISNIGYSEFIWKDQQYLPEKFLISNSDFILKSDDLLIALTRPITNNTTKICLYPKNTNIGLLNQRVACIKEIQLNKKYLFLYFQTNNFKEYIRTKFSETLQPNLSPKDLAITPIPLPSPEEQNRIVQEIESRLSVADKMEQSIQKNLQKAEALRQSILKKAFCGELV